MCPRDLRRVSGPSASALGVSRRSLPGPAGCLVVLSLLAFACGDRNPFLPTPMPPMGGGDWGLGATGGDATGEVTRIADLSRAALEAAIANPTDKIIRYEGMLGNVDLGGQFRIAGARNLTIEAAWVNFVGGGLVFDGAANLVLRNVRVRDAVSSGSQNGDCIRLLNSSVVRMEAVSCAYATDEGIDIVGGSDIALIDSIVAETLWFSGHPESPGHSFCVRVGSLGMGPTAPTERVLIANTLMAGCSHRVPQVVRGATVHVSGNTIYHYGGDSPRGPLGALCDGASAIFEFNNWIPGPESPASARTPIGIDSGDGPCTLFADGNQFDNQLPPSQADLVSRGQLASSPPFGGAAAPPSRGWGAQPHDPTDRLILGQFGARAGTIGAKDRTEGSPVPPPDTQPLTSPSLLGSVGGH